MKRFVPVLFPFFLFLSSFIYPTAKDKSLELKKATSQTTCSGIAGMGCGNKYTFTLITRQPSTKLKIDRLWIGKESVEIRINNLVSREETGNFKKNDSINVSGIIRTNVGMQYKQNTGEEEKAAYDLPYAYKGQALIGYWINKKRKYMEIGSITVLPTINHP